MGSVKIAILGCGTVGSGVADVFASNRSHIASQCGCDIEVKYIVDVRDLSGTWYESHRVSDFAVVENDPEVSIVVETIGGATIAYDFTKRALKAGKSVVTSNKELVATYGDELLGIARENCVSYLFEASVGGGIPLLHPISRCLCANRITGVRGILNGTTNYILTKMINCGLSFEKALQQAQELGYAEKDPTADVEGHDACRKICILASLISARHIRPDIVRHEGITGIALEDAKMAEKAGYRIKLLGRAEQSADGGLYVWVAPHLVQEGAPLSSVDDVFNGVIVSGDAVDDVMFYGRGAGKMATASAVCADVIDIVSSAPKTYNSFWQGSGDNLVRDADLFPSRWYVRYEGQGSVPEGQPLEGGNGSRAVITYNEYARADMEKALSGLKVLSLMRLL